MRFVFTDSNGSNLRVDAPSRSDARRQASVHGFDPSTISKQCPYCSFPMYLRRRANDGPSCSCVFNYKFYAVPLLFGTPEEIDAYLDKMDKETENDHWGS